MELLTSGGADRETLEALARSAKIIKDEPPVASGSQVPNLANIDLSSIQFNYMNSNPSSMETKMVIVVRSDGQYASLPTGLSAKLVSDACLRAYQSGQTFDPVSVSQWEYNAWPKICVKCKSEEELL